ncbi:Neprilysin-4 [Kappamyces sp. JEL0680]|nr:Neprilysin-4 [Kappamyces sp. JEL0680]
MDWGDMLHQIKLDAAKKVHVWSGLQPWIDILRHYDSLDRNKLQYYLLWRLATSHFNKLSKKYRELWESDIYSAAIKPDYTEIDSDLDVFQTDCLQETGRNLRYLAGSLFVQYAFNDTQREHASTMINHLFDAFRERIVELDWMDQETKDHSLAKLDNIVRVIGYPDWLSNTTMVVERYKPLVLHRKRYFENAVQAQVFTELVPSIRQSRHSSLDRGNIFFGYPWQLNAFHLTDLVLIQINSGVLQRPLFSELNPLAMNYGGIGSIIAHEITHGFDSIGSLLDWRGVRRHWMSEKSHHEFYLRSKCFVKQYNEMVITTPDGERIHSNGKKSLPENMADGGGMHTAFRAMQNELGPKVDLYRPAQPADPFSPAQTFFLALGQSWCSRMDSSLMRYMVSMDVHSPNPARVHGSIANSPEFARAFRCRTGSPMSPRPAEKMCRAY